MNRIDDTASDIRDALRAQAARIESTPPPLNAVRTAGEEPTALQPARRRRPRHRVGLVAGAAILSVGGVVAATGNPWPRSADYRIDDRSAELDAAVADKEVTFEEYQAGFERFRDCAESSGMVIYDLTFDESTSLFNFSSSDDYSEGDCYIGEWYALDVAWQLNPARPGYRFVDARQQLEKACAVGGPVPGAPFSGEQLQQLCDRLTELQESDG